MQSTSKPNHQPSGPSVLEEDAATLLKESFPLGCSNFKEIMDHRLLYIDKSDLIADLASRRCAFILKRPRGFGKTLLLSAFHELFARGPERFAELKHSQKGLWEDQRTYEVLNFDFAEIGTDAPSFKDNLASFLKDKFQNEGMAWADNEIWLRSFEEVLEQCRDCSLVLLIDNYDAPLLTVFGEPDEHERRDSVLYDFFGVIKRYNHKFRFVFIAGIGPASCTCRLNLIDISFDPLFAAAAGITQDELDRNLGQFIGYAALKLQKLMPGQDWSKQHLQNCLERDCGGYCFDERASTIVYSPCLLFIALSGGFPALTWSFMNEDDENLLLCASRALAKICPQALGGYLKDDFAADSSEALLLRLLSLRNIKGPGPGFDAILYCLGFLTIKKARQRAFALKFRNVFTHSDLSAVFNQIVREMRCPARRRT